MVGERSQTGAKKYFEGLLEVTGSPFPLYMNVTLSASHSVTFSNSAGEQNFSKKEKIVAKPNDFATIFWSRIRESNPPPRLGKPMYYRCTNPALHGSCVESLDIIASFLQKSNRFLAKRKNRASGGRPGGIQQSLAPAGMASSSMTRWSFSSPFSLCTAESSMPHDSWPIIFLGGRLTMAASVLPTRASGS